MSPEQSASTYRIYYGTGETSEEVDEATIRSEIEAGRIGIEDHVSKDGGPPLEFYHYDEFVDLWHVDESFEHIYKSESTHPGPASADRAAVEAAIRQGSEDQPSPFLPSSAESAEPEREDDLEDIFLEPDLDRYDVTQKSAAPRTFDEEPLDFDGYDPLSDDYLDAVTVRDLLYDSSLYTVLTTGRGARSEELYDRYMLRMEVLARRQRRVSRADVEETDALDSIRRLLFMAYEVLRDDAKRTEYEQSSQGSGGLPSAGAYLKLDIRPSPEALIEESLTELEREETGGEAGIGEVAVDDLEVAADELGAEAAISSLAEYGRVDFSTPAPSRPAPELVPVRHAGPRVYESVDQTLEHMAIEEIEGLDEELFADRPPSREQEAARLRERMTGARKRALSPTSRSLAALVVDAEYPEGLRWGAEADAGKGLRQVLQLYVPLFVACLGVVIFTDLGQNETDYSSPSPWFIGRGLLLLVLAVVGVVAIRREPITRLGLFPPPSEMIVGLVVGVLLGVAGGFVAPVYVPEETNVVVPMLLMLFIAVAHEAFFRGYVTRVLLVTFPSAFTAIATSCLFYGLFYLTYYNVLQQQGFFVLYYSVLLFGCALGGIYAALYWRSRSIWPSTLAHTGVLIFAMLVAV